MLLNMHEEFLLDENQEFLPYYSKNKLTEVFNNTFKNPETLEDILKHTEMNEALIHLKKFKTNDFKISFTDKGCGIQSVNGFPCVLFKVYPSETMAYPFYAVLYLNLRLPKPNFLLYIPMHGNVYNSKRKEPINAFNETLTLEEELNRYIELFSAKKTEVTTPEYSLTAINRDILHHLKFIKSKEEEELLEDILNLSDDYFDIFEVMYKISEKSMYSLIPELFIKLDILGIFQDFSGEEMSENFAEIYPDFEELSPETDMVSRIKLLQKIKAILEEA